MTATEVVLYYMKNFLAYKIHRNKSKILFVIFSFPLLDVTLHGAAVVL